MTDLNKTTFGDHLRAWRQRRRMSQLDLASQAGVSTRHLSFVETGRSSPSRDMVLQLAEHLRLPLREQNTLLVAAGYAPRFGEKKLNDPDLAQARHAVDLVLKAHDPNPALAIDRHRNMIAANESAMRLIHAAAAPTLLAGQINVLRISLHPEGLAPAILNLGEWRAHVFARLERQIDGGGDAALVAMLEELRAMPAPGVVAPSKREAVPVLTPLKLGPPARASFAARHDVTSLFAMPHDVTLEELAIESFFPANAESANVLEKLAHASG